MCEIDAVFSERKRASCEQGKNVGSLKHEQNRDSIYQIQKSQSEENAVISKNSEDLAERRQTWVQ